MARFRKAQELLDTYAQAKLVVTSNLHCALPCLAFGTLVIFIYENFNDERFPGNINLMRSYSLKDIIKGRVTINWDNPKPNPVDISFLRGRLKKPVKNLSIEPFGESLLNAEPSLTRRR